MATTPGGPRAGAEREARFERTGVPPVPRRSAAAHTETRRAPTTTEFYVYCAATIAVLIAGAVAGNLQAPQVWLIVGILSAAYMVSRGLAKAGSFEHEDVRDRQ